METWANSAYSYLLLAIDDSETLIPLFDTGRFPESGTYTIRVDTELMRVTGLEGGSLRVERGVEGTTPAAHVVQSLVIAVLTAASYGRAISDNLVLPGYKSGQILNASGARLLIGGMTWVNQGTATASEGDDGIRLGLGYESGFHEIKALVTAVPTAPWTCTLGYTVEAHAASGVAPELGLVMRESSTGKFTLWGVKVQYDSAAIPVNRRTNLSHYTNKDTAGSAAWVAYTESTDQIWRRIVNDGAGNYQHWSSSNGIDWVRFTTTTLTVNFTTEADGIGFGGNQATNTSQTINPSMHVFHFSFEE